MRIQNRITGLRIVFGNWKYLVLFISLIVLFSFVYIFEWNLILLPDIYVRADLWTLSNIFFLATISTLSSLTITLNVFNLKTKLFAYKNKYGYFAIIPAFFTSACSGCAPLLLSFTSTTFAIGLSIAKFGILIKTASALILLMIVLYLSSSIGKCKVVIKNKK